MKSDNWKKKFVPKGPQRDDNGNPWNREKSWDTRDKYRDPKKLRRRFKNNRTNHDTSNEYDDYDT